ncbi:MAG: competence/damage-inducible protein A [Nitrospirae bacterium]|nr:competence/damage-inducible protein A [Nitrospirota bacterium]
MSTAGIIIIGEEILSGKVDECNSGFIAKRLRAKGVKVKRISVIPDDIDDIAYETKLFSDKFDFVFTSGGLGPTHDDVTIDGIARGFGVRVVVDDYLREILDRRYGDRVTPERLKMAQVPEGANIIVNKEIEFPLIQFKNLFIFPGIPKYLKDKLLSIEELFNEPPILLKRVYVNEIESEIAPFLNEVVRNHGNVEIGSYPIMDNSDYRVILTFESISKDSLDSAVREMTESAFKNRIIRVDG